MLDKECKYCGEKQFGENDEFYPTDKAMAESKRLLSKQGKQTFCKRSKPMFSDEEILALGLYPKKDKFYKESLILRIVNKDK